jgi:hypothetical protein
MNGAANSTIGNIVAHEISHDAIQWFENDLSCKNGREVIALATAQVRSD